MHMHTDKLDFVSNASMAEKKKEYCRREHDSQEKICPLKTHPWEEKQLGA